MVSFQILLLLFVINFVESGRKLIGFKFKAVSPTGHKQCLKLCIAYAECLSVNFSRNRLLCELNSQHETETVQVTENTSETEDFIYIPRISFSKVWYKCFSLPFNRIYLNHEANYMYNSNFSLKVYTLYNIQNFLDVLRLNFLLSIIKIHMYL